MLALKILDNTLSFLCLHTQAILKSFYQKIKKIVPSTFNVNKTCKTGKLTYQVQTKFLKDNEKYCGNSISLVKTTCLIKQKGVTEGCWHSEFALYTVLKVLFDSVWYNDKRK